MKTADPLPRWLAWLPWAWEGAMPPNWHPERPVFFLSRSINRRYWRFVLRIPAVLGGCRQWGWMPWFCWLPRYERRPL